MSIRVSSGMLKASQKMMKRAILSEASMIQYAGQYQRLIADDADGFTVDAGKTDDCVRCKKLMYFEEFRVVDQRAHDVAHQTVALNPEESDSEFCSCASVLSVPACRVSGGYWPADSQTTVDLIETLLFALSEEVSVTRILSLDAGATEVFHRDFLTEHGFDDFGPVMNILEIWSTTNTKSVSAGEYLRRHRHKARKLQKFAERHPKPSYCGRKSRRNRPSELTPS